MRKNIGNLKLNNPFILAPLAGITDSSFRTICFNMGASLAYSEMVSIKGLLYKDKNTKDLLYISPNEENVGYQLFGSDENIFKEVLPQIESNKNVLIDINMGCPVPKVVKNCEGSFLLKNPDKIYDIVKACKEVTKKPVTCKIRLGWDNSSINFLEVGRAISLAGGNAITLHSRTREEYYTGSAKWEYIKKLKEEINNIPIIGNGDIFTVRDALKYMDYSLVDYIMIARGSLGNPWIFYELSKTYKILNDLGINEGSYLKEYDKLGLKEEIVSKEEKKEMILNHLESLSNLKGEDRAVREIRKHIGWYIKGLPNSAKLRGELNEIKDISKLRERILNI